MLRSLRNWWRGWDDADLRSLSDKFTSEEASRPYGIIILSERERRCLCHIKIWRQEAIEALDSKTKSPPYEAGSQIAPASFD